MSLQKDVMTLTNLCLQNIADNMQSVWLEDYMGKYMEEYNFLYIEGPFNQLAGTLVQELIRILGESHKLNKGSLHLLLQPHLTELSLRSCSGLVNAAILRLVTLRCKHLTSLDLHSCNKAPPVSLATLVEGLPRLSKLCLADTQCDPLVLASIGSCCPRLSELDLSRCKKISPTSLMSLVYDGESASYRCQALRVLLLEGVRPSGSPEKWSHALCFALLALPCLEQLSNHSLPDALHLLYNHNSFAQGGISFDGFPSLAEVANFRATRESKTNGPANGNKCQPNSARSSPKVDRHKNLENSRERVTLQLKKLEDMEEETVSFLGTLCPAVEEVAIALGSHSAGSWSPMQWPNLTQLSLHCQEQPERTLEEFLTMLHVIGKRLRVLSVQNLLWCQQDSVSYLLTMCPNLHSFQSHFTVSCPSLPPNDPELPPWPGDPLPLPRLHTFSLLIEGEDASRPVFQHKMGGMLVSILKGSPRLESLSLCRIPANLDAVFEVVYASSQPLQKLRTVSLCSSNLTQWGASLILRSRSDLQSLDLSHCKEVTCRDYHHLQQRVSKERRNVTITWQ